jgi:hypothetical protein
LSITDEHDIEVRELVGFRGNLIKFVVKEPPAVRKRRKDFSLDLNNMNKCLV